MAAKDPQDPRELGYLFALGQVGLEMVVPVALGIWLDSSLNWQPWGVIGGAVFGLVIGLAHLVVLSQSHDKTSKKN